MTSKRREYKLEAIGLVVAHKRKIAEVAESLGVGASTLDNWVRKYRKEQQGIAPLEFNDNNRMLNSPLYQRIVDVCKELVKFTWLTRGRSTYLTDRYSERVETSNEVSQRVNQKSL